MACTRRAWPRASGFCDSVLARVTARYRAGLGGRAGPPRARTTQASCAPPSPVFVTAARRTPRRVPGNVQRSRRELAAGDSSGCRAMRGQWRPAGNGGCARPHGWHGCVPSQVGRSASITADRSLRAMRSRLPTEERLVRRQDASSGGQRGAQQRGASSCWLRGERRRLSTKRQAWSAYRRGFAATRAIGRRRGNLAVGAPRVFF